MATPNKREEELGISLWYKSANRLMPGDFACILADYREEIKSSFRADRATGGRDGDARGRLKHIVNETNATDAQFLEIMGLYDAAIKEAE